MAENNFHIKTADEIFKDIFSHNEELIKVADKKEEKKEAETIDVTDIAQSLRKSAEITEIEESKEEEKKEPEKEPEKKTDDKPEKKAEEKEPEKKEPEKEPEKKEPEKKEPEKKEPEKEPEKKAEDVGPGPKGGGPEGVPPEPQVKEEKAHEPPGETKTDAKFKGPMDQGKIKESPAPDAGVVGASPDAKPKEPEQPKHEITDGEKPNNEIKIAMDKLVKVCQELYPVKGETEKELEKDAKMGLWAGIKKIAPFLFVASGAGGATVVAKEKRKKELPRVYGAGVRRGYFAGARASAQAYMKRFGGKNG